MFRLSIIDREGILEVLEVPTDLNFSLMEILRAAGYPIAATCGGMALCATCHVEINHGLNELPEPGEAETDIVDQLPDALPGSRLACQIRIRAGMPDLRIRLMPES